MTRFYSFYKTAKCFLRIYIVFGEAVKKLIRDICMDFEPCLKAHSLISVQHKDIKLNQMIHLNVIFHVAESNDRLIKI